MIQRYSFSKRSMTNLASVHTNLRKIAHRALEISPHDFVVTEGVRTLERQKQMVAEGKSKTMNSYHLDSKDGVMDGKGMALDFYPFYDGKLHTDAPFHYFSEIAAAFKQAAKELGFRITWGGDWTHFKDGPHIQLEV